MLRSLGGAGDGQGPDRSGDQADLGRAQLVNTLNLGLKVMAGQNSGRFGGAVTFPLTSMVNSNSRDELLSSLQTKRGEFL